MRRILVAALGAFTLGAVLVTWEPLLGDNGLIASAEAKPTAKPLGPIAPAVPPQHLYLIRATLGALQDANSTGNYSVLRDLAAPTFQAKHSAADLAELFAAARRKPIDLATATYVNPVLTETVRSEPGHLSLVGYLPGAGERIVFTLQFEAVAGHWRIAGIALTTTK